MIFLPLFRLLRKYYKSIRCIVIMRLRRGAEVFLLLFFMGGGKVWDLSSGVVNVVILFVN